MVLTCLIGRGGAKAVGASRRSFRQMLHVFVGCLMSNRRRLVLVWLLVGSESFGRSFCSLTVLIVFSGCLKVKFFFMLFKTRFGAVGGSRCLLIGGGFLFLFFLFSSRFASVRGSRPAYGRRMCVFLVCVGSLLIGGGFLFFEPGVLTGGSEAKADLVSLIGAGLLIFFESGVLILSLIHI